MWRASREMRGLSWHSQLSRALLPFLLSTLLQSAGTGAPQKSPYLIFVATQESIYRMNIDGSGLQLLVRDSRSGVQAVDYHYRLNLLFWTNVDSRNPAVKSATLEGTNIQTVASIGIVFPADLAVDWINNVLYWTDRGAERIESYDLQTRERRVVYTTGVNASSLPIGLAVYPYPGYGWLYWIDRQAGTIERITTSGESRETVHRDLMCVWPLTIEYSTHTIYWTDYCRVKVESIRIDGSADTHTVLEYSAQFSEGIAVFNGSIYWTQRSGVYRAQGGEVTLLQVTPSAGAQGIQVVHPSKQPNAEDFIRLVSPVNSSELSCSPPCLNGAECLGAGLCACTRGWAGTDCSIDVDECQDSNGGCAHNCTNSNGSYGCSCSSGYVLGNDERSCQETTPEPTASALSSAPQAGTEGSQPTSYMQSSAESSRHTPAPSLQGSESTSMSTHEVIPHSNQLITKSNSMELSYSASTFHGMSVMPSTTPRPIALSPSPTTTPPNSTSYPGIQPSATSPLSPDRSTTAVQTTLVGLPVTSIKSVVYIVSSLPPVMMPSSASLYTATSTVHSATASSPHPTSTMKTQYLVTSLIGMPRGTAGLVTSRSNEVIPSVNVSGVIPTNNTDVIILTASVVSVGAALVFAATVSLAVLICYKHRYHKRTMKLTINKSLSSNSFSPTPSLTPEKV